MAKTEKRDGWFQEGLKRIASLDAPPTVQPEGIEQDPTTGPNNVKPMLTADQREVKIREYNNTLVTIETQVDQLLQQHEKTRVSMVRLQEQHYKAFADHMMGWEVRAALLNPLKEGRPPAIKLEPAQP